MTNLTISLSDDTLRRLRNAVRYRFGGRKGAISGLIEESLRERLSALETSQAPQIFKAMYHNRVVAESEDLEELAKKLEELGVDPRSVRIISSKKLSSIVRTGLRGRS